MPNLNGNITLPNVEENESITVTGGSLTIFGDVGSGARITLVSSQSTIGNNVFISNGHNGHKLIVQGNVHDQANITGSSDMEFQGYLSDHIKVNTLQGNIIVKGNVGSNTTLKSINGNVSAENVGSNTTLNSINGNVFVLSHDPSATITTTSGVSYINGVSSETRRGNPNIRFFSDIQVGSSYGGSSFNSDTNTFLRSRMQVKNFDTVIGLSFINGVAQRTTPSQPRNSHAAANTSSSANTMPKDLDGYIKSFSNKESFQDAFKRLNIEKKEGLSCNISLDIPNIPVLLKGQLYDWESLKKLTVDSNNTYTDPMSREKFTLADIMPGRAIVTVLENQIKEKEVEQKNTPAFKH